MNRSFCNSCGGLVPTGREEREGKVFLVKDCPKCGPNETLVSSDSARHLSKRGLDPGHDYQPCARVNCLACKHHRRPTYAFVDVTNRCNLNCPMCADSVPGHGFTFDPPMEHFKRIFEHLAQFDPLPTVALFGGEPTVRDDLVDIVRLSRSYGLNTRVLTNGIRLADEDYCRQLVESRAHLLVSYDGCKPATYLQLRQNAKVLERKQKAIENLGKMRRAKVSYVTCLAWGLNDTEVPEILDFCHRQRDILHGLYLMPLVQTWDSSAFDYQPERMTTEDVERLVDEAFAGCSVQFISLGLASHYATVAKYLGRPPLPYFGTHPNCESFYLLLSDGERYLPVDHYLTKPLPEVAEAFLHLERRLAEREERWRAGRLGRFLGALRLRDFTLRQIGRMAILGVAARQVRVGRLLKGRGLGKLGHALVALAELALRRKSRGVRERHMTVQDVLRVIVLPLEDDPIIETERLERCPSVHVYFDPRTEEFGYVPVCAWRLHNKRILGELAAYYSGHPPKQEGQEEPRQGEAVEGEVSAGRRA